MPPRKACARLRRPWESRRTGINSALCAQAEPFEAVQEQVQGELELELVNPGGLTCGTNRGSAITGDYHAPFPFTGTLHTVDLSGDLITDTDSEMRMAMPRQ